MVKLEKDADGDYRCPKGHIMEPQNDTMYYRGRYFAGLVCEDCNALFDNPDDSMYAFAVACAQGNGPKFGETVDDPTRRRYPQ